MNKFAKAALCGALLSSPIAAQASDCSSAPTTLHEVDVVYQGFFPSLIYVCAGDTIRFRNATNYWIGFHIKDGSDGDSDYDFSFYWTQYGQSRDYVVDSDSGVEFVNFDVAGRSENYDGNAEIIFGTAPKS